MRYVKIKSKTYNEAMMKLRMEYGDDAIPVSHKYVKEGGLFNSKFFANDLVELTVAIPEMKSPVKEKLPKKSMVDFSIGDIQMTKDSVNSGTDTFDVARIKRNTVGDILNTDLPKIETRANREILDSIKKKELNLLPEKRSTVRSSGDSSFKGFEKELLEIKNSLNALLEAQGMKNDNISLDISMDNEIIEPYMTILRNNEFDQNECNAIIKEVKNFVSLEDMKDKYKIEKTLKDLLKNRVLTSGPIKKGMKKKIIMFIGPTGVGKTTTMAKLGAIYSLRENYNVAFVTIDTYRIAATEQLKKYAGIMKIPVHVVNDQNTFKEVINNQKADIIMVDTSGRSHKNDLKLSEIKSYADMIEHDLEKILCVSANTRKSDLQDVFKAFEKINYNSIIITKVDESSYIGSVIDVADKFKKPISYYTNGQEVPNDISIADPDKIINMMVGSVGD